MSHRVRYKNHTYNCKNCGLSNDIIELCGMGIRKDLCPKLKAKYHGDES
jgi:hypothetical protein